MKVRIYLLKDKHLRNTPFLYESARLSRDSAKRLPSNYSVIPTPTL